MADLSPDFELPLPSSNAKLSRDMVVAPTMPPRLLHEPSAAKQRGRALLGWLGEQEMFNLLLGHQPLPLDDLARLQAVAAAYRAAVAAHPVFHPGNPLVNADMPALDAVAARPDVQTAFAGMVWQPAMVDLRDVIAFQKVVNIEGLAERVAPAVTNRDHLLDLCVPTTQPLAPTGLNMDADGKGFTMSSDNPNLRIAGAQVHSASVSPEPGAPAMQLPAITFVLSMGTSFLQVARYKDRYFLRDGYHRAVGLVRAGISIVPGIYIEAKTFHEAVSVQGALDYEVLFGDRPPLLTDFWDDAVSGEIHQLVQRKVIRVSADEFNVQGA